MSALSVLAEHPERIRKLFISDKVNDQGVYGVWITKNGMRHQIVMDDYIPVYGENPAFSQAHKGELWVLILEKAWAKIHGSYERIEAGQSHLTMRDLTGAPAYEYFIEKTPNIFDLMLEADEKHYIITSGCNADNPDEVAYLKSKGLVGEHSYGIIRATRIKDKNGAMVDLCQLRNPWGSFEWKGRWSDKSDCWTPALKKQLEVKDEDDGLFWMDFEDLNDFFPRVQICKYNDNHKYSFEPHKGTWGVFYFLIDSPGMHTFSISQLGERMVPRNAQYYYSDCRMFIIKGTRDFDPTVEKNIEYIAGSKDFHKRDSYLEVKDLKRGYYYLFCEVDWSDESSFAQQSYNATCYGESKITFENRTNQFQREDIVRATCTAMLRDGKVQSMTQGLPGNEAPGIQITEFKTEFSYAMYQIQNNEPELTYIETADFLKFDKVELMMPE